MSDSFRDLEMPARGGRRNAVLMATVSTFETMGENLSEPTRHELRQFADLFVPLFQGADPDARRTAAAALSRARHVPEAVRRVIVDQPIDVAAPFLVNAGSLDDDALTAVIETHGPAHARAVARRAELSPRLVEALLATGDGTVRRTLTLRGLATAPDPAPAHEPAVLDRDEKLREKLRAMVAQSPAKAPERRPSQPSRRIAPDIEERLLRHVRQGEPLYFATALADALGSGFDLAERIMLDVSGRQLAETLVALGMRYTTIVVALEGLFPYLAEGSGEARRSLRLVRGCEFATCLAKVAAWLRADADMMPKPARRPVIEERQYLPAARARDAAPRPAGDNKAAAAPSLRRA